MVMIGFDCRLEREPANPKDLESKLDLMCYENFKLAHTKLGTKQRFVDLHGDWLGFLLVTEVNV